MTYINSGYGHITIWEIGRQSFRIETDNHSVYGQIQALRKPLSTWTNKPLSTWTDNHSVHGEITTQYMDRQPLSTWTDHHSVQGHTTTQYMYTQPLRKPLRTWADNPSVHRQTTTQTTTQYMDKKKSQRKIQYMDRQPLK